MNVIRYARGMSRGSRPKFVLPMAVRSVRLPDQLWSTLTSLTKAVNDRVGGRVTNGEVLHVIWSSIGGYRRLSEHDPKPNMDPDRFDAIRAAIKEETR